MVFVKKIGALLFILTLLGLAGCESRSYSDREPYKLSYDANQVDISIIRATTRYYLEFNGFQIEFPQWDEYDRLEAIRPIQGHADGYYRGFTAEAEIRRSRNKLGVEVLLLFLEIEGYQTKRPEYGPRYEIDEVEVNSLENSILNSIDMWIKR